jgi:hypothetical protein
MIRHCNKLFSIFLFAFCVFLHHTPAQAQACTPSVYLFRHAEDVSVGVGLTPAGKQHAELYPQMLSQYQSVIPECPVKRVLAMYDFNPDGTKGTTNPRDTAEPLARACCGSNVEMQIKDTLGNMYPLFETISSKADGGLAPASPGSFGRIFYALQGTLNSQGSVAIFWTQQGMGDVSQALGVAPVFIPNSNNPDPALSWPGKLRSSVNTFTWTGTNYVPLYVFTPKNPPKSRLDIKPAQCFKLDRASTKYSCQNSGFLMDAPIGGKFCITLSPDSGNNYGYCM